MLLLLVAAAGDAFFVEPNWIEVSRYSVPAPLATPLKIAHLSDLHTSGVGFRERRLLRLLDAERPDLIIVTGDTVASGGKGDYGKSRQMLARLHAPLGVWLVRGNWENWRPVRNERAYYAAAGVNLLVNEARAAREDVWLAGFDDAVSGTPDREAAFRMVKPGAFVIALFHSPAYFDQVAGQSALALAGHTHGGQVRIPLVPPLWLPHGSGRFLAGWYEEKGSRMYVSRGVGTSVLPVRFLCRPEVAILNLVGTAPAGSAPAAQ